jgi:hypothetical protein
MYLFTLVMGIKSGFFENLSNLDFGFQARKSEIWVYYYKFLYSNHITFITPIFSRFLILRQDDGGLNKIS